MKIYKERKSCGKIEFGVFPFKQIMSADSSINI